MLTEISAQLSSSRGINAAVPHGARWQHIQLLNFHFILITVYDAIDSNCLPPSIE